MRHAFRQCAVLATGALISLAATTLQASESGGIEMELNRLQQMDAACRLIVVFTNRLDVAIDSLEVETVLFNTAGQVERFLLLKSQPLGPGKIRVHQYDLADTSCASTGSILVNDVVGCEGSGLDAATCLSKLNVSSRESAALVIGAPPASSETAPAPQQ